MNCVSCDICVYHVGLFVFFPRVFLSSRVTEVCPVTTDLIMRVNVRTTIYTQLQHRHYRAPKQAYTKSKHNVKNTMHQRTQQNT